MAKDLKVYFILPSHCEDETNTSEPMTQAFELCCQNQIIPDWLSEAAAVCREFVKTDIVVFDKFEGKTFENVKDYRCLRIVGPWCLISCLLEGLQVPNNRSPVYTMAMSNLVVSASSFSPERKKEIKEKVELMGGVYTLSVTNQLTHLVTNNVRTEKYAVAQSLNKPVMLDSWIVDVWKQSCVRNVKATDDEFLKHKCPLFQNLRICCTGFAPKDRNLLQETVCKNGGLYSGKLITSATDILICNPNSKSEKFEVAKKAKLPCLLMDWIFESVKKGYAIPDKEYILRVSSSTPTKSNVTWNHDFSMMSMISGLENVDHCKTSASDTINMSLYNLDATSQSRKSSTSEVQKEIEVLDAIDTIDLKQVKEAGIFLDGCGVYLVGFSANRREKMIKILKTAGATRYDEISDRVTQIVVGDAASSEVRALTAKGCGLPMVSVKWIIESMKKQQPANEDAFAITCTKTETTMPPPSPLSKKGLTLLQNDSTTVAPPRIPKFDLDPEPEDPIQIYRNKENNEEDTLAQLLMQGDINSKLFKLNDESKKPDGDCKRADESVLSQDVEEAGLPIFTDKIFKIIDHNEEDLEKITEYIEELEGRIVSTSFKGITDYVVVPPTCESVTCKSIKHTATEVVNSLYICDCYNRNAVVTIEYYHQPYYDRFYAKPLKGCVVTLSGFVSTEREFLMLLIEHLGAFYQDRLARLALPSNNVLGSTHLICLEPSGGKYSAAVKWNIPVLKREWILKCLDTGTKFEESVFTFGKNLDNNQTPRLSQNKSRNKPQTVDRIAKNVPVEPNIIAKDLTPVCEKLQENISGKRKSPVETKEDKMEQDENDQDNSQTKKLKADETDFANAFGSQDDDFSEFNPEDLKNLGAMEKPGSPVVTLEGGRIVSLRNYMMELRAQGLFDTPSPARQVSTGTPHEEIIARLRRKSKIPEKNVGMTPTHGVLEYGSQGTPIGKYIRSLKERNVLPTSPKNVGGSKSSVDTPDNSFVAFGEVKTPDTPLGRFLGEDEPSRETKKHWQKYLDQIPQYNCHNRPPASAPRRPSTPWSEVKKQAWAWLLRPKDGEENPAEPSTSKELKKAPALEETESQKQVTNQMGKLQDMFKRRDSSNNGRSSLLKLDGTPQKQNYDPSSKLAFLDGRDSQADTVGWDEPIEANVFDGQMSEITTTFPYRKFMLSSLEASKRGEICNTIKSLGGDISELGHYDDSATHVVCNNPSRNEKVLSSMAAGKWIVHADFVQKSGEQGKFLPEQLYEFGNPQAASNLSSIPMTATIQAIHWWRKQFLETNKGAFSGMRVLIFAKNRSAVVRLVQAGQGVVVQAEPPFDHSLDVTHCFIDAKMQFDYTEFIPLTEQNIQCVSVLYLSNYLNNQTKVNIKDYIIQELKCYYK